MKAAIFTLLTIVKVVAIGYSVFQFLRHFRSDGKKALNYLGIFLLAIFGITALEFAVAFMLRN